MKRKLLLNIALWILAAASVIVLIRGLANSPKNENAGFEDSFPQTDINNIKLGDSGVEVRFTDVILSKPQEQRKLIVCRQKGEVSTLLTDKIIEKLDFDFMKKTQEVHYEGEGYFVVNLDSLTAQNVVDDKERKILTIYIDHPVLETVDIDPNKITVGEVDEGLLARGDIKLTVKDFNDIEKKLKEQMVEKFNTVENGQQADAEALKAVKEIYEPVIKALDKKYDVEVKFKGAA